MLDPLENSNCHMNVQGSTVKIQHEFSMIFLQFTPIRPANDG
jgi:hypothetical protein